MNFFRSKTETVHTQTQQNSRYHIHYPNYITIHTHTQHIHLLSKTYYVQTNKNQANTKKNPKTEMKQVKKKYASNY